MRSKIILTLTLLAGHAFAADIPRKSPEFAIQLPDGKEDFSYAVPEHLAAVESKKDKAIAVQRRQLHRNPQLERCDKGINAGISGYEDSFGCDCFPQKILPVSLGRSEVQVCGD